MFADVRDVFGFLLPPTTPVLVNAFERGPLNVLFVDHAHGLYFQGCARVELYNHDLDFETRCLRTIVSVKAMRHFTTIWRRNAQKQYNRRMRRNIHWTFYKTFPRDTRCMLCSFFP